MRDYINHNYKSAYRRTEEVLKNYNFYKAALEINSECVKTQQLLFIIDAALKKLEDDHYIDLIELIYFENKTREFVAEYFNCDVKTITRNKNRLINILKCLIFSDKSIEELFY